MVEERVRKSMVETFSFMGNSYEVEYNYSFESKTITFFLNGTVAFTVKDNSYKNFNVWYKRLVKCEIIAKISKKYGFTYNQIKRWYIDNGYSETVFCEMFTENVYDSM